MMDPYRVLGLPQSATNDEIKKAYRQLSRRYHPDANINNPHKDEAEAKFKEVQQAYNQVMKEWEYGQTGQQSYRQDYQDGNGRSTYQQGYGGFGGFGDFGSFGGFGQQRSRQEESPRMQAVRNYINSRHYTEALHVLSDMVEEERNARWYYYSALANSGVGNTILALDHAQRAVQLEPNSMEYSSLLNQLQSGGQWYQSRGQSYGNPVGGLGNCCMEMICLNCFCNCCC